MDLANVKLNRSIKTSNYHSFDFENEKDRDEALFICNFAPTGYRVLTGFTKTAFYVHRTDMDVIIRKLQSIYGSTFMEDTDDQA
jgi:hypothetical protein